MQAERTVPMIHVMNPYQLSTSMFRLAAYSWDTQVKMFQFFTQMASQSNPMMLSREAILKKDVAAAPEPAAKAVPKPVAKPAAKPRAKPVVKSVAKPAAKPAAARKTAKAPAKAVATTAAKKTAAKKTAAKSAPKAASAVTPKTASKTSDAPETRKYRAPSKPPAMPNGKSAE